MSLQDPTAKMSKSDSDSNAYILLQDSKDQIARKIKRAVTDSVGSVNYTDDQPGIKNLINIHSVLSGKSVDEIVQLYDGKGYGVFKSELAEVVIDGLDPIQTRYRQYLDNKDYLEKVYSDGANKAEAKARKTLRKVYKKIGFIPRG
jgi:tryptophanyl-tRNA synthetase